MGHIAKSVPLLLTLNLVALSGAVDISRGFHLLGNRSVEVEQGTLVGRAWRLDSKSAAIFRGVPYAEAPIGKFRFERPSNKSDWSGVRLAHKYGSACIQYMDYHAKDRYARASMDQQSEDCLYLNLFIPNEKQNGNKGYAVLFWIHGGSFLAGSGNAGMDDVAILRNIVFKDVILVTINYRLGAHGFLTSGGEGGHRGNIGLWDQVFALEWVARNIAQFGGDPDQITIIGESAGGASASLLALSPVTEGLVQRAIIMSGSVLAPWSLDRTVGENGGIWNIREVADYLSCRKQFNKGDLMEIFGDGANYDSDTCPLIKKALDCADYLSTDDLWECFKEKSVIIDKELRKALTIELGISKAVVDEELIPFNVSHMMAELPRIPIMTGVAQLEWGHKRERYYGFMSDFRNVSEDERRDKVQSVVESSYASALDPSLPKTTIQLIGNASYYHYLTAAANSTREWNVFEFVKQLRHIESDAEFVAPCAAEATAYAAKDIPVYLYSFERVPTSPVYEEDDPDTTFFGMDAPPRTRMKRYKNAYHGLDHAYLFTNGYSSNQFFHYDDEDKMMAHVFSDLITNFVKFGNPTPNRVDDTIWPPFSSESSAYMKIARPLVVAEDNFYWQGVSFWNHLVPSLKNFAAIEDPERIAKVPLTPDEHLQLAAYRRAWWALWILVATIAFVLWAAVVCMVARRCMSNKSSKTYKSIVLTEP